jgi:hypothetical protein
MVTNLVKEKKNGSSNHTPNNGHSWGSVVIEKGGGNITCEVHQRSGIGDNIEQYFLFVSQG